jgi:hypothetical protein
MTRLIHFSIALQLLFAISFLPAFGATSAGSDPEHARFVGVVTCQSSMCHGGAAPLRCQYTIWSHDDDHSRAYATLVTAYGINIAKAAHIDSPTTNSSCVKCHAPLALIGTDLAPTAHPSEGVTCESCHNGAATWLRSHTRPDFTYADRVESGMRDMRNTLVRANTCVECHQNIAPALVRAGHPALTFELDGQDASEPRHWREKENWFGAKAWLVGQAVALREIASAASPDWPKEASAENDDERAALVWLLQRVPAVTKAAPPAGPEGVASWSNQLAQTISNEDWSAAETQQTLAALAGSADTFRDGNVATPEQAARAVRLVLALDRLLKATHPLPEINPLRRQPPPAPPLPGEAELATLFDLVQEDPKTFDAKKFADSLQKFADIVAPKT